jgi:selenide,water dikinase
MSFASDPTAAVPAVRLTQQVKAGGCANKLALGTLNHVLSVSLSSTIRTCL